MARAAVVFPADQPAAEVAREFRDLDIVSAPVLDDAGRLRGQITIDDIVDVISEQADR